MKTISAALLAILAIVGLWVWVATDGGKSSATAPDFGATPRVLDPLREYFEIRDLTDRPLSCKILAKRTPFVQVERELDRMHFIVPFASLDASSREKLEAIPDFNLPIANEGLFNLAKTSVQVEVFYIHDVCYTQTSANGGYVKTADGVQLEGFRGTLKTLGLKYHEILLKPKVEGGDEVSYPPGIDQRPCLRIGDAVLHDRDPALIKAAVVDHYVSANSAPNTPP